MNQLQCETCGKKDALVFHCNYCGGYFCAEHHLPESHDCTYKPKIAPAHIRPQEFETRSREKLYKHIHDKHHSNHHQKYLNTHLIKRMCFGFLKFIAFSIFTIATGLPLLLYTYMIRSPTFLATLNAIYIFNGSGFLWYILIPNLGYVVVWFITVYNLLRGRAKWWYYLILLIFGLRSWWGLSRVILMQNLFGEFFKWFVGS